MEVLGATASIVGLMQVTGKLTVLGYGYIRDVKQASKDISDLTNEISSFTKVLSALKTHVNAVGSNSAVLSHISDEVRECQAQLSDLLTRLDHHRGKTRWLLRSLKWPLHAQETRDIIQRIERYKSSFSLAINTSNHIVTNKIDINVKNIEAGINTVHLAVDGLHDHVQDVSMSQRFREDQQEIALAKKRRREVLDWLYPESYDTKHSEIRSRRQKNTGEWLLQSEKFQELIKQENGPQILWGYGIPGAGKTFLSSRVIDHLQKSSEAKNYGVAHVYFDYKSQDQQTPACVVSSLIKELAMQLHGLPDELGKLYDKMEHHGKRPSFEDLENTLVLIIKSFNRVFVVLDALDECNPKHRIVLLPFVHRICDAGAYLFVTSRYYPEDIQRSLHNEPQTELLATSKDIENYVIGKIDQSPRAKSLIDQYGSDLKKCIIAKLIDCAHGMFLLVHFHIEYLCAQTTVKQLISALETMKASGTEEHPLDPTYGRVMQSIQQQPRPCQELAMNVLTWLVMSLRTITVEEVRLAVSVQLKQSPIDELDLPHKETLLEVCAGLVTIDEISNIIRLSHMTVEEYLLRTTFPRSKECLHNKLATACTSFLFQDTNAQSHHNTAASLDASLTSSPFFEYTARHMPVHLRLCDISVAKDLIVKLQQSPTVACRWIQAHLYLASNRVFKNAYLATAFLKVPPILHMASLIGNCPVLQQLLDDGEDISATCTGGKSVLHWGVLSGDLMITRLLVDHGASLLSEDNRGLSVLYQAARSGDEAAVNYILASGISPHLVTKGGRTALFAASEGGHDALVRILLKHGARVSFQDKEGCTSLHAASYRGHDSVVRILLENGADYSIKSRKGNTALHNAASRGHEEVIQTLLKAGADSAVQNEQGLTPLHKTALDGHTAAAQVLLQSGVTTCIKDEDGDTALHIAARAGHAEVVRLLLSESCNPSDIANDDGETPLFLAVASGHSTVVKIFLEYSGAQTITGTMHNTSSEVARQKGHEAVVKVL